MKNEYNIPKRYYTDHVECDCEAPEIIRETSRYYVISAEETPELAELRSRANFYVDMASMGAWDTNLFGIVSSARATLKIIGTKARA